MLRYVEWHELVGKCWHFGNITVFVLKIFVSLFWKVLQTKSYYYLLFLCDTGKSQQQKGVVHSMSCCSMWGGASVGPVVHYHCIITGLTDVYCE